MAPQRGHATRWFRGLFALPFAAMLWIGAYDRIEPPLFGIPFFYWYQLLWIPLGALVLLPAYMSERKDGAER